MFRGQKGIHARDIFKWKWSSTSSLTTGLLNDLPQEIELSDYHNAPSHGSESPSGLLDGEVLNAEPIDDLDLFFERVYTYYCEKGLCCIIVKWIFELLSVAFTICFSGFFLLFVDWNGLRNAKCGMDAVESGIKPCDLSKEALHKHPLTPLTLSKGMIVGYLVIFSIYWIFCFLRFFAQLKQTLKIRQFYYNSLHVTDNEIQTMPWSLILEKVVQVQHFQQLCVVKDLSTHDVVMRLMRKENYMIGMLNKGVLAFPISRWVPGAVITANLGPNGAQRHLVLPKILEWTLNWCILQSMFDRNFRVRRDFVSDPQTLKKTLMIVGIALFLLAPFLVIFMLVFLFLRHAEQFYNHPSTASSRRWSNLSKWMFREFNEVDHLFKHRMNSSIVHASDYLKQFPSPILTIVAKFISFVSGGFAAVLIIIAFLEESLLEGHIFGRNLFWYAAVFGAITAISRAAMIDELLVFDPHGAMSLAVQHTHYMPKRWRGKENTETVRREFETLFQYSAVMLLEEMASIFLTPFLLIFVVPKRVDDILQFIKDFTADVEGVGHVCSFSLFDFKNHGNRKYGSPFDSSTSQRSSQGKMEKSFLSFHIAYPSWEPKAEGKQFLDLLKVFRDQKLQGHRMAIQHQSLNLRDQNNSFYSTGMLANNLGNFHPLDSMWLINGEQKNFPYILDWYYTSQNHDRDGNFQRISPTNDNNDNTINPEDPWNPSNLPRHDAMYDDKWDGSLFDDRVQSHLEASSSAPLLQKSILQHHESFDSRHHHARSLWWARTQRQVPRQETSFLEPPNFYNNATHHQGPRQETSFLEPSNPYHDGTRHQGSHPETSFLEPPNFYHVASRDFCDNISERSTEEHQQLDWRNSRALSRTFYIDDIDGGANFDLPFDDIYMKSPRGSTEDANANPDDLV